MLSFITWIPKHTDMLPLWTRTCRIIFQINRRTGCNKPFLFRLTKKSKLIFSTIFFSMQKTLQFVVRNLSSYNPHCLPRRYSTHTWQNPHGSHSPSEILSIKMIRKNGDRKKKENDIQTFLCLILYIIRFINLIITWHAFHICLRLFMFRHLI